MADVDFELFQINNFKYSLLNVSNEMDNRKNAVDSAVETIRSVITGVQELASRSMSTMSSDRGRAFTIMGHNKKKLEEISSELGRLRNSNTEGCNNSLISSKENEYNSVQRKIDTLQGFIDRIDICYSRMESNISRMKNLLYKAEGARDRFHRCFGESGYQGEIQRLAKKVDEAYALGDRALHALALEYVDYHQYDRLTIYNIEGLKYTATGLFDQQKSVSDSSQQMMKSAYEFSNIMQSEIARNTFMISKEISDISEEFSKMLGKSGNALKEAYGYLYRYKNLLN